MKKFQILIQVDERKLKEATELDEIQDTCEVIKSEMSWVKGSGIYPIKVQPYEKNKKPQKGKIPQITPRTCSCGDKKCCYER